MLAHLDTERMPRKCPGCDGGDDLGYRDCLDCDGTGRLGDPDYAPDLEIGAPPGEDGGNWWRVLAETDPYWNGWHGPYPTPEAALEAARAAWRAERCRFCGETRADCTGGGLESEIQAHDFAPGGVAS